jgi:hypothetical protein
VSFKVDAGNNKRNSLTQIKLSTTQPGVKVHAPQGVHAGTDLE